MKPLVRGTILGILIGGLVLACASPVTTVAAATGEPGAPAAPTPAPTPVPVPAGRGKVTFTPYFKPSSAWSTNLAAQRAVRGLLDQYEGILSTGGAWDANIELYLNDEETNPGVAGSAYSGSYHTVTYKNKKYSAVNPWVQIVQGSLNPNGAIDPATGAGADAVVRWNFAYSDPSSNIGLLRHELMHALGMTNGLSKPKWPKGGVLSKPGVGTEVFPTILNAALYDAKGKALLGDLVGDASKHTLNDYAVDADWDDANGSGVVFRGISDAGANQDMPMTSWNSGATWDGSVDFAHVTVVSYAYAHPSWNTLADVDRAFLRGLGYTVSAPAGAGAPPAAVSAKSLTVFSFAGLSVVGTIDQNAGTIRLVVPYQTSVTSLVASFTFTGSSVSVGAAAQTSGTTPNDFSSPVVYTVKGSDGATRSYTVTVGVEPKALPFLQDSVPGDRRWYSVASSADGTTLLAADNSLNLFTSGDSGRTWTERVVGSPYNAWSSVAISADGRKMAAAASRDELAADPSKAYLFTSSDAGATWTKRTSAGARGWSVIAGSTDGSVLVAAVRNGSIFVSMDGGATWTEQTGAGALNWAAIAVSSDGSKILLVDNQTSSTLVQSNDTGATWSKVTGAGSRRWASVALDATGKNRAAAVYNDGIYTSSDNGVTWTKSTAPQRKWTTVTSSADGTKLAAYIGGEALYTSADSGASWTYRDSGAHGWMGAAMSADGTRLTAVSYAGPLVLSSDFGANWTTAIVPGSRHWSTVVSSANGSRVAAATRSGYLYTSMDSGNSWTEQQQSGIRDWTALASNADGSRLIAGDDMGLLYSSTDFGVTWSSLPGSGNRSWVALVSSADGTKLAAATYDTKGGPLLVSTDSGVTWTEQPGAGNRLWSSLAMSADGTKLTASVFATYDASGSMRGGGYLYTSSDSGATWTERTQPGFLPWRSVASSSDGTRLTAAADRKTIFTSTDSGATWQARATSGNRVWWAVTSNSDGTKLAAVEAGDYSIDPVTSAMVLIPGPLLISTDAGATWTVRTDAGLHNWISLAFNADGTKLVAAEDNGGMFSLR